MRAAATMAIVEKMPLMRRLGESLFLQKSPRFKKPMHGESQCLESPCLEKAHVGTAAPVCPVERSSTAPSLRWLLECARLG